MERDSGHIKLPNVGVPVSMLASPDQFGGARIGDLICGTLRLFGSRVMGMDAAEEPDRPTQILLPRLTETHIHLDKCHSIERIADVGGNLEVALTAQSTDKERWTVEDLDRRARRGMDEMVAAGVGLTRSHVDWHTEPGDPDVPLAWDVLGDLTAAYAARGLTLERAALTGIDEMADPARAAAVAQVVARDGAVLGSFIKHHTNRRSGIENIFREAEARGLAVDFHVDEGLDPALDGVELVTDIALEMGVSVPILCGHACGLASKPEDEVARVAEKLAKANIAVAVLPTTNLYLQGRVTAGTPDRRGLTRIHELTARGVNVVIGTDNVRDAFCPIGRHDPMHSLSLAVLAGHLDPPFDLHLPMVTSRARAALGAAPLTVDGADAADLILFEAASLSSVIAGGAPPIPLSDRLEVKDAR